MSGIAGQVGSPVAAMRQFYVWMAGTCFIIAVLGFMPSYFFPMARGTFSAEPVVHIHGLILFSWVSMFFSQSLLVARGNVLAHREWGLLGVSLMTAVVFITLTVISLRIAQVLVPGTPLALAHDVIAFEYPVFIAVVYLAVVFTLSVVTIRRPQVHKRLLLLATISMLGAPIGRWFTLLFAPPADPASTQISVPPVFVLIPPSLVADLLIVVAMAYDWRMRGSPHRVYLIGGGILLFLQLTAVPASNTAVWQAVAHGLGHLAG
jgi:hypothetical protein